MFHSNVLWICMQLPLPPWLPTMYVVIKHEFFAEVVTATFFPHNNNISVIHGTWFVNLHAATVYHCHHGYQTMFVVIKPWIFRRSSNSNIFSHTTTISSLFMVHVLWICMQLPIATMTTKLCLWYSWRLDFWSWDSRSRRLDLRLMFWRLDYQPSSLR